VTKLKQIGDVVLATPAIAALRAEFPGAALWALVPCDSAAVLVGNPHLDRVVAYGRGILAGLRAVLTLAAFRPDWVVQLGLTRRERWVGLLCGARRRAGFAGPGQERGLTDWVSFDWSEHVVANSGRLLERLGVRRPLGPLVLAVADTDAAWVEAELAARRVRPGERVAVVHPVTRWLFKSGRDEVMAAVMDGLCAQGYAVAATAGQGAAELDRARRILGLTRGRVHDFTGRLSLGRLAALLRRAALVVTVDGAPMHMAAALGVPQVVLFGPTGERNWAPWMAPHAVVAIPMLCRPCGMDGCAGSKISDCLQAVEAAQILAAVRGLGGSG
jgi:heptosyltransferase-3